MAQQNICVYGIVFLDILDPKSDNQPVQDETIIGGTMDIQIDTPEFDEFIRKLEELEVGKQVSLDQLFHDAFMLQNSTVNSFQELLDKSGFKCDNQEDFENIPDADWDEVIRRLTRFADWDEMKKTAASEWMKKQLEG